MNMKVLVVAFLRCVAAVNERAITNLGRGIFMRAAAVDVNE